MGFDKKELIGLDECVFNALDLFIYRKLPKLELPKMRKPLVVGSGNAAVTGKIIFSDEDAVFADEGNYKHKLKTVKGIDGGVLISASGGKHAPIIARELKKRRLNSVLLTNNPNAAAKKFVGKSFVFPKNREPYTYNTSTYLSMIISKTGEEPRKILSHISKIKGKIPRDFRKYDSFYILVPEKFDLAREMFMTKFDELFGSRVSGRVFTVEQTKHAKTVVLSPKEMFIGLGVENKSFGKRRYNVPMFPGAGFGAVIAVGYFVIGFIQKQHPSYFKDNILSYTRRASRIFGQEIKPIVE